MSIKNKDTHFIWGSWKLEKYGQLFSWKYLMASLSELYHRRTTLRYTDSDKPQQNDSVKLWDGTLLPPLKLEHLSAEVVDIAGLEYVQRYPAFSLGNFTHLDKNLKLSFIKFVQYLKQHGVKVIFYLPAYERNAYSGLIRDPRYSQVFNAEKYFKQYAKKNKIVCIGSYDPKFLHLKPEDFIDGMHMKASTLNKIWDQENSKINS